MIKFFILSFIILFSNLQSSNDNFSHKITDKTSKYLTLNSEQPVIKIYNEKDNSTIFQIITIFVGFIIMAFQVYWQHKGNLKLQEENSREELKLAIYKELEQAIHVFNKFPMNSYLALLKIHLKEARREINENPNLPPSIIDPRANKFLEYNRSLTDAATQLGFLVERWEIITPEFKVFRLAIYSVLYDLSRAFSFLYPSLLENLPVDLFNNGKSQTIWPKIPDDNDTSKILSKIDDYMENYDQLSAYIYDIQVIAQNILLGNLFKHRVEYRKPLDPKSQVLNFDIKSIDEWIYYFKHETNWGISCRESEEEVKEASKDSPR